ncbi:DUF4143 domain-containing protein [bacterium]|nr:DUF4143 domain-containing protein [bacterium]
MWSSQQIGALWENYVVILWLRYRDWFDPSLGFWYWRDQGSTIETSFNIEHEATVISGWKTWRLE